MGRDSYQATKWRRLGYTELVLAALLGGFAGLAIEGEVGVPAGGALAPVLTAIVMVGLGVRSLHKARGLS